MSIDAMKQALEAFEYLFAVYAVLRIALSHGIGGGE